MSDSFDSTIFEQDGVIYFACVMDPAHARETAKDIAREIREMHQIPRSRMRVIPTADVRIMPWGSPKDCTCARCQRARAKAAISRHEQ